MDGHREHEYRALGTHGNVVTERPGTGGRGIRLPATMRVRQHRAVRPADGDMASHRQHDDGPCWPHGDVAAQRSGARGRGIWLQWEQMWASGQRGAIRPG